MRVAHLAKYAFYKIGGVERHVVDLTVALAAKGVDVTVFSYDEVGDKRPSIINGVKVEPIPASLTIASQSLAPGLAHRFSVLDRGLPFDIVHGHWPDPFAHFVCSVVARRSIHVATWHMDIVRQRALGSIYRGIARVAFREPSAVITATQAHLNSRQLEFLAPNAAKRVIPFGINEKRYGWSEAIELRAQRLRERLGPKPKVFALGRHVYYKGFSVLIRAMSRIEGTLLLGGHGPLTEDLRVLARDLGVDVVFLGPIPDEELPEYFYASDVFCLPSCDQTEAFGLAQAEAMACGRPIVNTDLGNGVNELAPTGLCALTVPVGDEVALASALSELISNREMAKSLGEAGRVRIKSLYSVSAMVDSTLELYRGLISG